MNSVTPRVAASFVSSVISAGLVPMIHGSPGIGKSDITRQVANEYNLKVIDVRLSQCDPTDLNGFPTVVGDKAGYRPMDTFPIKGDTIPDGFNGWLIFFDEINSAPNSVQAAAYKILLDRMIGQFELHEEVVMVCAGNLESDGAITNRIGTAMQSRMVHVQMDVDTKDWLEWAQSNNIDSRVTSYIQYRPKTLQMFDPDHNDMTFACPRTWEFASRLISKWDNITPERTLLLAGVISEGPAREFAAFLKVYEQLPKLESIISSPQTISVPDMPSTLYALSGVLADNTNSKNVGEILQYVGRMPREFQVITLREMGRRYPQLTEYPSFMDKVTEFADLL